MQRVRYRGPDYRRPHSSERGYFSPPFDPLPPSPPRRSATSTSTRVSADLEKTAAHEAGHLLLALLQRRTIRRVSIYGDGSGICCTSGRLDYDPDSPEFERQARRELRFLLAGQCAAAHVGFPASKARAGSGSDMREAEKVAAEFFDMDPDNLNDADKELVEELFDEEREKVARIFERNDALLGELAAQLESRKRLESGDIDEILEDFPLTYPPKRAAPTPVKRTSEQLEIRRLSVALLMRRDLPIKVAQSFDATTREAEAVISTGRAVRRTDWDGEFDEILDVTPNAVRLERLNAGAQLLDSHRWYGGLDAIVGAVVPGSARVENGKLLACFKFSNGALGQRVAKDLADGLPLQLSAGYKVHAFKEDTRSSPPVRTVIDWEPYEVSIVSVPAESSGTCFRSQLAA